MWVWLPQKYQKSDLNLRVNEQSGGKTGWRRHKTDPSWILVSSLNCDLGQATELLSFSCIKQSPSELPSGSIKVTCNISLAECAPKRVLNEHASRPYTLSIRQPLLRCLLCRGTRGDQGEYHRISYGFISKGFLISTILWPYKNRSKDKKGL